ncbi:MAG: FmdB family transcriptional regulator [Verrucomicrobia bacterium]|nr:FmdB family transcriptional regulator [Verrucomicrobiota bacterium]
MPIYEYYCPDNHRIYQFYAKTLAQGRLVPKCPDDPSFRMEKMLSTFAVTGGAAEPVAGPSGGEAPGDPRMEAAMGAMEKEFSQVDENDPRAMARMMRRMAELTGEKINGEMEEVVRKLEEGVDPDSLEEKLGAEAPEPEADPAYGDDLPRPGEPEAPETKEGRAKFKVRRTAPVRDPRLYDYE